MDGYILIHGKNTGPTRSDCAMGVLAKKLIAHSLVDYQVYPWSWNNLYWETFDSCIAQIQQGRDRLIQQGATRIHLVGHSLGGNAVIYYASLFQDYSTLILLAPAHNTEIPFINWLTNWSTSECRRAIKSGRGDEPLTLVDFNVDRVNTCTVTPNRYMSFFSKDCRANMTRNARLIVNSPHVYCIAPTDDTTQASTEEYLWNQLTVSEQSVFVRPNDTHNGAARNYHDDIVKWVDNLKSTNLI
jgi:pimeloyl-ACP methyl ester carboxylesterase